MSSRNANSSDLQLARELSHRVTGRRNGQPAAPTKAPASYVALRAQAISGEAAVQRASAEPTPGPRELPSPPETIRTWDDMLRWCQEAAEAKTVFVMDAQGFVIAKEGSYSYEDAEAMGTQLMVALDRFDELDTFHKRAQTIAVSFRSFYLTGLRIPPNSRDCFTLGILRTDAAHPAAIAAIGDQVAARAAQL